VWNDKRKLRRNSYGKNIIYQFSSIKCASAYLRPDFIELRSINFLRKSVASAGGFDFIQPGFEPTRMEYQYAFISPLTEVGDFCAE